MKKHFYILVIILGFLANHAKIQSQPYYGGEIGWECQQNGKYIFYLKAFQDCNTITFGTMEYLYSNTPLGSIALNIVPGYPKEISPSCNSNSAYTHITCLTANQYHSGGVKEYLWKSNEIALNGIPPTTGWIFHWTSCCRPPSDNIINATSLGYSLRSVMYPNGNKNAYPCHDNSPSFAEPPRTIIPQGNSSFSYHAIDADFDSLVYVWGQPWSSLGNPITNYVSGYAFSNPLPDSSFNPKNVATNLNSKTGIFETTVYNPGAYEACVNVKSFRKGVMISNVYRENMVVVYNSDTTNNSPQISPNQIDTTVFVGDIINLNISATDFEFLPLGPPQEIRMKFIGQEFGSYVPPSPTSSGQFDSLGCPFPPCARMNPAPPPGQYMNSHFGINSNFSWKTDCNHLSENAGGNGFENSFYFIIDTQDDFCPVPAVSSKSIKIKIKDHKPLPSVDSLWVHFDYVNEKCILQWTPVIDSNNQFLSYNLYYSSNPYLPYTLVDSITDINTVNSNINIGLVNEAYFYMVVKSRNYCNYELNSPNSTSASLILTNIHENHTENTFQLIACKPNPAKESTEISFSVLYANDVIFQLTDLQGKTLERQTIKASKGNNTIQQNLENLEKGMYFYSIELDGLKKVGRLIVE
jgi:hypothetical protein